MTPAPSPEQQKIIDSTALGNSVCIHACAGAGKSTAVRQLCEAEPLSRVQLIVYNKRLQLESEARAPGNLACATLHSLADGSPDDATLIRHVEEWDDGAVPDMVPCDIFVIDEAQDMSALFIRAIRHLVSASRAERIVILGDPHQCIYTFGSLPAERRAVDTMLLQPERVFPNFKWEHLRLSTSYRLTPPMARFLNPIWGTSMVAGGASTPRPVRYYQGDPYGVELTNIIIASIRRYGPGQVMILAPTIGSGRSAAVRQCNIVQDKLCKGGQLVSYTSDPYGISDNRCMTLSTWHGSKGTERQCVIVFDACQTSVGPPDRNALGVACSRALEELVIVHGTRSRKPLPYASYEGMDRGATHQHLVACVDEGVMTVESGRLTPPTGCTDVAPAEKIVDIDTFTRSIEAGSMAPGDTLDSLGVVSSVDIVEGIDDVSDECDMMKAIMKKALWLAIEMTLTGRIMDIESQIYPVIAVRPAGLNSLDMIAMQAMKCGVRGARSTIERHWRVVSTGTHGEFRPALARPEVERVLELADLRTKNNQPVAWGHSRPDELLAEKIKGASSIYRERTDFEWPHYMYFAAILLAAGGRHNHLALVGSEIDDFKNIDTSALEGRLDATCAEIRKSGDNDRLFFDSPHDFHASQPLTSTGGGTIITGLTGRTACHCRRTNTIFASGQLGRGPDAEIFRGVVLAAMCAIETKRPCTVQYLDGTGGSSLRGTLTVTEFGAPMVLRYALERARTSVR